MGPVPRLAGMARSPDGTKLATSEEFDGLQLWSGGVPRQLDESRGVAGWLGAPAYSPDGRLIAVPRQDSGGGPLRLSLHDAASAKCVASLPIEGERGAVYCRFLARGVLLSKSWIASEQSFRVRLWSLEDPSSPRQRRELKEITAIESSPDGAVLAVAEKAGPVTVLDSGTGAIRSA